MKKNNNIIKWFLFLVGNLIICVSAMADDTCTFMSTANDIPPNIVILLDNGAEMEQIVWHSSYSNSTDYTPNPTTKIDIVQISSGNGFYRSKGYSIVVSGSKYYLVEVPDDLNVADHAYSRMADGTGKDPIWTINGKTITLPAVPSASVDSYGIKDNATYFRYSANYLNWIFYSTGTGAYTGNGSDLPRYSRFYFAKKALMTIAKMAANQANFSIYNFTANANGASNVQPLGLVVNTPLAADPANNTLQSNYINNVNNMGTVIYSPLAEGLASIGGYYASPSSHIAGYYCQKNFALVVSPGMSSEDQSPAAGSSPSTFSDYDKDNSLIGEGKIQEDSTLYTIPVNQNGSTYLDDVADYLYNHDIVGYQPGFQNINTYTVGFMGDHISNLFLINTSNNGNGNSNLYDSGNKDYAKYHYVAQDPDQLATALLAAVNDIISQTNSFTAPVVPVTRTTSGNRIYMAFFKPEKSNFWEGNITKFGLSSDLVIVDKNGSAATYPNGAMIEGAQPYWQSKDWATNGKNNYILNSNRKIYTYLGSSKDLTSSTNAFNTSNITATNLGNPTHTAAVIINYIRGADVFDENKNLITTENRSVITGDVLHSEPLVFHYTYSSDGSYNSYVFFGSNDGMLHAVKDSVVTKNTSGSYTETNYGQESWAFIPPDLLPKLKNIIEGVGHQYLVDSSPKAYFIDHNNNGIIDTGDQVILVCGERKGGSSYFALDITDPESPKYLWRIDRANSPTSGGSPIVPNPDYVITSLGQSWSEPQFGLVKTSSTDTAGTPVLFIGAGQQVPSDTTGKGKAVLAVKALTGEVLKTFSATTMGYVPGNVLAVDVNDNGFVDKVYVGDLSSQMWRLDNASTSCGIGFDPSKYLECENINNWSAQTVFVADTTHARKFYYPPTLTLEYGYDLLFFGTGDRDNACSSTTSDRFYSVKDMHGTAAYGESDLVDITSTPLTDAQSLDNSTSTNKGWYYQLASGEKVLAENTVYFSTVYFTTFKPDTSDLCVPGGISSVYAMQYKTGGTVLDMNHDGTKDVSLIIGGGIPSKPVMVITDTKTSMLISVGSTNPEDNSQSVNAGVINMAPLTPDKNFFYRWWRELTNY